MLDYIIMGMVLEEELTGYDIVKEVQNSIGNFYKANYGRLYPALSKLAEKGFLTMREEMQGKRLKKYYQTTALGRQTFLNWLSAPVDPNAGGDFQLAQIFFYGELPKELRDQRLREYEALLEKTLQQLQQIESTLPSENLSDKDYFGISTLYYGFAQAHNTLRWLAYIREQKPLSQFLNDHNEQNKKEKRQ
ncbi:MAG: PadR family transcriptional regulator [Oscillospiraceae bacterium]|nr:PadR family transcriptional regulator [Oscillospiraceae bacterium]